MKNVELIKKIIGTRFFSVTFTKKDGTERTINARLGVKKYLKGGEKSYNDNDFNYLTVYSVKDKGYRTVNLDTIKEIKLNNRTITLGDNELRGNYV
jgi:hypothetical protein